VSEICEDFGKEPNAAFRFVNPVLCQTRRRNILMTFADLVRQVQKSDQLFVVGTKLSQHVFRSELLLVAVVQALRVISLMDRSVVPRILHAPNNPVQILPLATSS